MRNLCKNTLLRSLKTQQNINPRPLVCNACSLPLCHDYSLKNSLTEYEGQVGCPGRLAALEDDREPLEEGRDDDREEGQERGHQEQVKEDSN